MFKACFNPTYKIKAARLSSLRSMQLCRLQRRDQQGCRVPDVTRVRGDPAKEAAKL